MEEQKQTTREAGIRYGLILGVISILYFIALTISQVNMTEGIGRWGGLIFTVVIFVFAHKHFKENGDGYMSLGQGVGIAFWASLISATVSNGFTFIYIKFIDEGFIQNLKDMQYDQMVEQGMSDSQIDQAMSISAAFMTPGYLVLFGIIGGIIMGLIFGVIISLFTQKKNPDIIV